MAMVNYTTVSEFLLLGLTDQPELQIPLFVIFLGIYAVGLVGNLGMIVLIVIDSQLHTPMYFFLCHLAFADFCYSTVITPKMLVNFLADVNIISFQGCAVQFYFFGSFAGIEGFLLAVMAYDRYNAICNPLLYKAIMSWKVCTSLVIASFLAGFMNAAIHTYFTFQLQFCDSNRINHFFCDTPPLLALSCSDIHINLIIIFIFASFNELSCLFVILISYIYILSAILRITSSEGRRKAFSTCASHLLAVTIFFGTILFMYLRPSSSHSMEQDKIVSVFYTVVIPMLNPLIYSLRNREVKDALRKAVSRKTFF
ncbi:olfactory receptor 1020-like [Hemicordylus capensis]|uniref:olfactory receptor 1020-like n=1 Tax=Hemicordylus capensis TaxID=884348 RepID=UPI002303D6EC|nr:olfactory receptor 1020-like [Hemicordylus capensis]